MKYFIRDKEIRENTPLHLNTKVKHINDTKNSVFIGAQDYCSSEEF